MGELTLKAGKKLVPNTISVRLPAPLRQDLQIRVEKTGLNYSDVVREALRFALAPSKPAGGPTPPSGDTNGYQFPHEFRHMLHSARMGAAIWAERRARFRYLLALSEAAREINSNPLEQAICTELLRIGRQFKLL